MKKTNAQTYFFRCTRTILGIVAGISIIVISLITAFETAMYSDYEFYRKEYRKYEVLSQLDMKMSDVMHVTVEMMEYLRGNREKLSVVTTVDGKKQDFFNEQDRLHMKDVKFLFDGGVWIRRWMVGILIGSVLLLVAFKKHEKPLYALCRGYQISLGIFTAAMIGMGIWIAIDFNEVFTKFHEIFFTNDLWLFDPETDYMIRMLPEGLFFDFVVRIGVIFAIMLLVILVSSFLIEGIIRYQSKKSMEIYVFK